MVVAKAWTADAVNSSLGMLKSCDLWISGTALSIERILSFKPSTIGFKPVEGCQ
jgi:hypothetical protein